MTIQTIDKIDMLDFKDLSTIVGGVCSFWGATAAVGVGAVGPARTGNKVHGYGLIQINGRHCAIESLIRT